MDIYMICSCFINSKLSSSRHGKLSNNRNTRKRKQTISEVTRSVKVQKAYEGTVESRSNGPASNRNTPITEASLKSLEKFLFFFYISNNRKPPITDKNGWSLEIRKSGTEISLENTRLHAPKNSPCSPLSQFKCLYLVKRL